MRVSSQRFPTLGDQLYQLASGMTTSVELVRHSLHAITASQSTLNAFRGVLTGSALAEAAEADRRRAAGDTAPLLGIPIAVKDDVDIAGLPTFFDTTGRVLLGAADAEVVRRRRRRAGPDHRRAATAGPRVRQTGGHGHRPEDDRRLPGDLAVAHPGLARRSTCRPGSPPDGLPIGVQLMGPANSEPMLVSLAAELEAVSGWSTRQPEIWWNTPVSKDPSD